MLEDYPKKMHSKLKSRARKGIPDSYRIIAWKTLALVEELKLQHDDFDYKEVVKTKGSDKGTTYFIEYSITYQLTNFDCRYRLNYERHF